uniref:Uncharacterized protein n=1 Tax=Chrysotila carterae TaxID=13221 RepID=A0A7S4AZN0_CHRCT
MSTDADGGAAAAASQGSISQEPKASVQEPEASVQETSLAVSTTLSIDEDAHVRLLLRSCSPSPIRTPKRHKEGVAIQEAAAAYANPHKEAKETTVGPSKETGSAETPKAVSTSVNIDDNGRVCITLRCGSAASIE